MVNFFSKIFGLNSVSESLVSALTDAVSKAKEAVQELLNVMEYDLEFGIKKYTVILANNGLLMLLVILITIITIFLTIFLMLKIYERLHISLFWQRLVSFIIIFITYLWLTYSTIEIAYNIPKPIPIILASGISLLGPIIILIIYSSGSRRFCTQIFKKIKPQSLKDEQESLTDKHTCLV
ncbi:unnamed protein product [Adineta steineri]|uniref:Uncharacterized protein n=1 Tax=Adineta steineri TaxID=433720 RepID=A0A814W5Y0_9BILA|nr:unnamed protein product [Adineta steineri]CAF3533542.1 unnamed protein product [Adineta steineri]